MRTLWSLLVLLSMSGVLAAPSESAQAQGARLLSVSGGIPLHFEPNQGQTDGTVKFLSRAKGYGLFLTPEEVVLVLSRGPGASDQRMLRLKLLGANPQPKIEGVERLPGKSNYFIGNDPSKWRTGVPHYAKVGYAGVYPGIDLVFYGNQRRLEYDFVVAAGADPKAIRLSVEGAERLQVDARGDLVLYLPAGEVRLLRPQVYQVVDGRKVAIAGRYEVRGKQEVAFQVAAYDDTRALIIDPVLNYSTYLGGSDTELVGGIAVDAAGNAYVTGLTSSANFPTTAGAFQTTFAGGGDVPSDAFVTKLNPTRSALVYSTYLGGSGVGGQGLDRGFGIAVDATGNAYVTGTTSSPNFPTTAGALQTTYPGAATAFVTKLNPTGSALVYSTYLGGGGDSGGGIAVNAAGNAYVAGETSSLNFPTTVGAFQTTLGGFTDAFMAKLNPTGSTLVYSTYLGGSDTEMFGGIALDASGNAYVAGYTQSSNFPTTVGAFQTTLRGLSDAFVTTLNSSGSALVYSTYLGGTNTDVVTEYVGGIAVDASGNAYVTGRTRSPDFPTTAGAFQRTLAGQDDAFVTKLNPTGSALVYSTYLGGSDNDLVGFFGGGRIAVDASGNAYVTGSTSSPNFPTTAGAFQTTLAGAADAFVTKLNPTGSALVYSTYLGGSNSDGGDGIALDASGNAYAAGGTSSPNFPTTAGAVQTTLGGAADAFVTKIVFSFTLSIATNAPAFRTGDSVVVSVAVDNPGLATTVDFYFGALLPDGDTVVFFTDLSFNSATGRLSAPATLRPILAGVDLTAPFTFSQPSFFTYRWTGGESAGSYVLFLAAVKPGALVDNSVDAGDLVALATAVVTFTP